MATMKKNGVGLAGVIGTLVTLGIVACGDDFASDCMASRSCPGTGGTPSEQGGGDAGPNSGGADATDGGGSSSVGLADGGVGAGGVGANACTGPEDCDNGNPADGIEICREDGVCAPGNAPPTVMAISPDVDEDNVETDVAVVITFSEPLDEATVTSQSVQVIDGDDLVEGELTYADGKVTFTPAQPFALLAQYSVKVGTGIADADGAALVEQYASSFTTRDGGWSSDDAASGAIYYLPETVPVTQTGDVLVAWSVQGTPGVYCPTSARWFNGGETKGATKVFAAQQGITECTAVAAAANAAGVGAVAWQEDYGKEYVEQYRADKWPANVGTPKTVFSNTWRFGLGVAPNGAVSFLQHGLASGTYARSTSVTGTWLDGEPDIGGVRRGLSSPRMAFDSNGSGFAAWRADKAGVDEVAVAAFTTTDGSQPAISLPGSIASSSDAAAERGAPAIAVDDDGGAMALWMREGGGSGVLVSSRYTAAGGWEAPVTLSGTMNAADILDAPGLVFDGTNYVAAFTARDGASAYVYSATFEMEFGEWTSYQPRTTAVALARMPALGVDGHGNLLLTWLQAQNAAQATIMFARFNARAGEWSDAVAVPGGIVKDNVISSQRPTPLGVGVNGHAAVVWGDEDAQGTLSKVRIASFY